MRITNAQRIAEFGDPADGRPPSIIVDTPWGMRVRCQADVAPWFLEACARADEQSDWKPHRIDHQVVRSIRGAGSWSLHSWALAWDFFATAPLVPPPGGVWTPHDGVPADFAAPFEELGFTWGARWTRRPDVPHIEWAGPRPTGLPEEGDDMTPDQAQQLAEVHRTLVGHIQAGENARPGDVHDLATPILTTNALIVDPTMLAAKVAGRVASGLDVDVDENAIAEAVLVELAEALGS